jgi:hypothetical protein
MRKSIFHLIVLSFAILPALAQTANRKAGPSQYAQMLGPLPDKNLAEIADTLTTPFSDKREKALAIYSWIARNISIDPKATRGNDKSKSEPVLTIRFRKSTPHGFALLYQEMASLSGLRCLTIEGYTRSGTESMEEKPEEPNHSWNVVQLGQSPADWFYVDAAKGSGYLDHKQLKFQPRYSEGYFFTSKQLFDRDHFPENKAWQLGPNPPSGMNQFMNIPVLHSLAFEAGMQTLEPSPGMLKIKMNNWMQFRYRFNNADSIYLVELLMGTENTKNKPQPMNFNFKSGELSFEFNFKQDFEGPLQVRVNERELCTYLLKVEE